MKIESVKTPYRLQINSSLQPLSRGVGMAVSIIGFLVLAGWWLHFPGLRSIHPVLGTMSPYPALCFVLAGASLSILREHADVWKRILGRVCAETVTAVALVTLAESFLGWKLRLDLDLCSRILGVNFPARMPVASALAFLLLGLALLLLDLEIRRYRPAQLLALLAALIGSLALIGYGYGFVSIFQLASRRPLAFHTVLMFLLLSGGILAARPGRGVMSLAMSQSLGGVMARRLLPAAAALPVVIGWLIMEGQRAGIYPGVLSLTFFALAIIVVFTLLIWWTANSLHQADLQRQRAEVKVSKLNVELEQRVLERTVQLEAIKEAEIKLQAQLSRLDLLHRITRAIGERQDLPSIFQVIIRSLEDNLSIDFGCVCLYDSAAEILAVTRVGVRSGALAMELALTEQSRIPIDQNGLSRCVRGQLVYEPDLREVPFPFAQRLARGGLCSLVAAPLLVESKVFGVLVAARCPAHSFSSADCEFLRQLTEHVALAAHQAQLYGTLQQAYDDLRQTQQTVMQQERLRALGQMASGIAHDINNAISPVALYTESLLERETNLSERARDYLVTIQRAIEDVAETVSRMREFYRPREPQLALAPIDLNLMAQQVVDLTRARWSDLPQKRGIVIQLQTELMPDLPSVMGAQGEIRDSLTNLVFNAVDAMPEGGTLTLRTRTVSAQGRQNGPESGTLVYLEVGDTGVGMDEETKRRCLEPFFTTKGERGTGLGLAMVYGMVERHSAQIEIDSQPGQGTTVRLIFPVSVPAVASSLRPSAPVLPAQRLRILIVDDDPLLIKSLRDALESEGHLITAADGGQAGIQAFEAAKSCGESFAVVITDLGMPYVDGRRVAAAVKAASPSTPVILLTGWGQRLMAEHDIPPHVDRLLSKPPKLHELRGTLAELTASSAETRN